MMITCVTVFTLCWLPLNALQVIGDQYPEIYTFSYILYIWFACHFLAMSHACYNPVIYIWMNSRFRSGFKYIVSQMVPCLYRDGTVTPPDFLPHNVTTHTGHFNLHHSSNPTPPHHPSTGQPRSNSYKSSSLVSLKRTHHNNNDHTGHHQHHHHHHHHSHPHSHDENEENAKSPPSHLQSTTTLNQASNVTSDICTSQKVQDEREEKSTSRTISSGPLDKDVCREKGNNVNEATKDQIETQIQTQVHHHQHHPLLNCTTMQSAKLLSPSPSKGDSLDTSSSQLEKLECSSLNQPMAVSLNINSARLKSPAAEEAAANEYKRCHRQSYPCSIKSEKDRERTKKAGPVAHYLSLKEAVTVTQSALDSDSDEKTNDPSGQTQRQTDLQGQQHSITKTTLTGASDVLAFSSSSSSSPSPLHPPPRPPPSHAAVHANANSNCNSHSHSPSSSSECDKVHPLLLSHSLQLSPCDSIVKDRENQCGGLNQCICANETTLTERESKKASSQQNSSLQSPSQSPSSSSPSPSPSPSSPLSPRHQHDQVHLQFHLQHPHPPPSTAAVVVNCSGPLPGQVDTVSGPSQLPKR